MINADAEDIPGGRLAELTHVLSVITPTKTIKYINWSLKFAVFVLVGYATFGSRDGLHLQGAIIVFSLVVLIEILVLLLDKIQWSCVADRIRMVYGFSRQRKTSHVTLGHDVMDDPGLPLRVNRTDADLTIDKDEDTLAEHISHMGIALAAGIIRCSGARDGDGKSAAELYRSIWHDVLSDTQDPREKVTFTRDVLVEACKIAVLDGSLSRIFSNQVDNSHDKHDCCCGNPDCPCVKDQHDRGS